MITKTPHVTDWLGDYVLDLLADTERRQVEAHTAVCTSCHEALQRQRRLGRQVREVVAQAGAVDATALRRLMPGPPRRATPFARLPAAWRPRLAAATLVLVLLLGGAALRPHQEHPASWPGLVATSVSATATATRVPTATATQVADPASPEPAATPVALAPLLH